MAPLHQNSGASQCISRCVLMLNVLWKTLIFFVGSPGYCRGGHRPDSAGPEGLHGRESGQHLLHHYGQLYRLHGRLLPVRLRHGQARQAPVSYARR